MIDISNKQKPKHLRSLCLPFSLTVTHTPGEDVGLVSGWFLQLLAVEDELCHLVELLDTAGRHLCQAAY